ncbi:hypothetical protein J7E62_09360 [Variovorax paradoxus]|nr:hypothetical protein [Variovorax paradoxus]
MKNGEKQYVEGAEMISELEDMIRKAEAGEIDCVAFRVYNADGTFKDVAAGGTEEQREALLAKIREQH